MRYNEIKMYDMIQNLLERAYDGYVPDDSFVEAEIVENGNLIEVYCRFTLEAQNVLLMNVPITLTYGGRDYRELEGEVSDELMAYLTRTDGHVDIVVDFDFHTEQNRSPFVFDMTAGTLTFKTRTAGTMKTEEVGHNLTLRYDGRDESFYVDPISDDFKTYVNEHVTPDMLPDGAYISDMTLYFDPEMMK